MHVIIKGRPGFSLQEFKKKRDSGFDDDTEDYQTMEEESTLYEAVWEELNQPSPPKRTTSIRVGSVKKRYDLSDFKFLKILGKGSFGKVNFSLAAENYVKLMHLTNFTENSVMFVCFQSNKTCHFFYQSIIHECWLASL